MTKYVPPSTEYSEVIPYVDEETFVLAYENLSKEVREVFPGYVLSGISGSEVVMDRYALTGSGESFVSFKMKIHSAEIHRLYLLLKKAEA